MRFETPDDILVFLQELERQDLIEILDLDSLFEKLEEVYDENLDYNCL